MFFFSIYTKSAGSVPVTYPTHLAFRIAIPSGISNAEAHADMYIRPICTPTKRKHTIRAVQIHTHEHLLLLYHVTENVKVAKFNKPQIKRQVNVFLYIVHPPPHSPLHYRQNTGIVGLRGQRYKKM